MESKKLGGKMRSSLHKMMGISFSKCSMSSFFMTVEVRFLKKNAYFGHGLPNISWK